MGSSSRRVKPVSAGAARKRKMTLRNICLQMDEFVIEVGEAFNRHESILEWHDEWVRWGQLPWYKRLFTKKPVIVLEADKAEEE